ncbi:uncharacterized protein LOC102379740 isoform X2 [Alligator sinensis]|uniref:Uncharacterized protein LOC102379740 isoform X2 n=1 Tax=Alligator sinensis TaxID=38654 RepID=A0A3Q0FW13_ALLSI|nr:uncharacterized protein LOC102379740 isoform X2 [Alligator sinensis]
MESIAGPTRPGSSCSCPSPARPELSGIQVLPRWDPPDQVPFAVIAAVQDSGDCRIHPGTAVPAPDGKSFQQETRLSLTGSTSHGLGAEYICRVGHVCLGTPVERSSGEQQGTGQSAFRGEVWCQGPALGPRWARGAHGRACWGPRARPAGAVGAVSDPQARAHTDTFPPLPDCDYNRWESYRVRAPKAQLQCAYKGPPPCVGGAVCPPQHAGPRPED